MKLLMFVKRNTLIKSEHRTHPKRLFVRRFYFRNADGHPYKGFTLIDDIRFHKLLFHGQPHSHKDDSHSQDTSEIQWPLRGAEQTEVVEKHTH